MELVGFLDRHHCIGIAVEDQYGTSNLSRRLGHIDFLQVFQQGEV